MIFCVLPWFRIKTPKGSYPAFTSNGRESTGVDLLECAVRAADLGAGAVVTRAVPASWIVAGNPAIKIGLRD